MTSKNKTKAADWRGHHEEPVATGNPKSGVSVVDAGISVAIDAAAAMAAPAPEPNAIAGGEGAVGENGKIDDCMGTEAGSSVASIIGLDAKPTGEISTPRPGRDNSKEQHSVTADRDADRMSPKLTTSRIPTGKNARIAELVSRSEGAGLSELASATGWQRHTVRAALTRLRQAGFAVELRTGEDGRRTYHHVAGAEASS